MNKKIKIGKFTLESLTTGMYSNPLIIFREYIQNSTDAIDLAIEFDLLKSREEGRIEIEIDSENKNLSITDNGTGIPNYKVWNTLCDIGSSKKDFSKQRGFRGIGRLGGLSYANELKFVTSVKGENKKTIVTWDCKKLRNMLRPGTYENYDLTRVIQEVTNITSETENEDVHYFRVELINIEEQFAKLLDENEVKSYLTQVAPIPFHAQRFVFYHDAEIGIKKQLDKINKPLEEYYIYINGDPNPLYKPYKNYVKAGKGKNEKRDSIKDIKYIKEYLPNGDLIFWGWYAITGFLGYVKDDSIAGLRVRKNNILIGDFKTLDDFFSQPRFNRWFIGEIYVYDKDILPNARRDDFEKNKSYEIFEYKMKHYTKEILSKIPPAYSGYNSAINKIEKKAVELEQIEEQVNEGVSSEIDRKQLVKRRKDIEEEIQQHRKDLEKVKKKIKTKVPKIDEVIKKTTDLENKSKKLEKEINDAEYKLLKSKALSGYSKDVKKVLIKVFEVIDKELPSVKAKDLEMSIIECLRRKKNNKK